MPDTIPMPLRDAPDSPAAPAAQGASTVYSALFTQGARSTSAASAASAPSVSAASSAQPGTPAEGPTTAAPATHAVVEQDRRQRLELELAAADHLSRLNGALELHAATLALLLPRQDERSASLFVDAWQAETAATPNAAVLKDHVSHLSGSARLPWLETLVSRMRAQPIEARQSLLESTRRLMAARRSVRPIDRLHWLAMRQWLGEGSAAKSRAPASADLSQLPQAEVSAIASYTAFLSRLIPIDVSNALDGTSVNIAAIDSPGRAWYVVAIAPWQSRGDVEPCNPPDTDGLVHALQTLQAMAWMQRPTVVRGWVTAAQQHSRHGRLTDVAADALRLSCVLLDSPMPPELARHYGAFATAPNR